MTDAAPLLVSAPFAVRLPLFEGPFDLLLFFIERDELDIHDIPIARIAADFTDYLRQLEALDVEVAADFILTAATLMRIKAKMLLPRKEIDETTGQEIDPREDLVRHLLEYRRFKAAVADLAEMEAEMLARFPRGNVADEQQRIAKQAVVTPEDELHDVSLYKLLRTFERAMARFENTQERLTHTIFTTTWTVSDQKEYLRTAVANGRRVPFGDVIAAFVTDRLGLVFTFIAVLELLQLGELRLGEGEGKGDETTDMGGDTAFNQFWVSAP
jgi:segregation and condensation protein A